MDAITVLFGLVQLTTLLVVALTVSEGVRGWRALAPWERAALVGLVLLALAWRLAAPAGPHDVNARSKLLAEPFVDLGSALYGWGRPAAFRVLMATRWTGPWSLDGLANVTAVHSALAVGALAAWLRIHGHPWTVVGTAGALVAIDPLLARFGHTDAPQIHELLPWFIALAAWTAHTREPSLRLALLGGGALAMAATTRPESVLLLPVALVIAWAQGRALPWRVQSTQAGVALAALLPLAQLGLLFARSQEASLSERAGWTTFAPAKVGLTHWIAFQPHYTPSLLSIAVLVGALTAPGRGVRRVGWVLAYLSLGLFVPDASWTTAFADIPVLTRHQLRAIPFAAILVGFAVQAAATWIRWRHAGLAAAAVAIAARLSDQHVLTTPYTIHAEHRFFVQAARQVPEGCAILAYRTPSDTGLVPPIMERVGSDRDGSGFLDERPPYAPLPDCVYWYRGGLCSVVTTDQPPPAEVCGDFEARHTLEPIVEARLPSHPWLYDRHTVDPVPVGLYRIVGQ